MKQLSYTMKVKHEGKADSEAWEEKNTAHVENDVTAEEHAKAIVEMFNHTLRPRERPREFVEIVNDDAGNAKAQHVWEKVSLVTEKGGYDKMKCSVCGATGKRHGLGQNGVTVDTKFKKYGFFCPGKK